MPKKPSDFLNKKRSRGNGDFARPKAKVGRKVKRRAGETDASFQTRQLSITEQSVAKDRAGAKVSRRGLTLDEHLGQLAHHSAKQRTAACDGAREITTAHGDEAWRCFAPLLDGAARLINDDDGATRRAASKLIRDAILPTAYGPGDAVADEQARQAAIVAAAPLFAARLGAALSSFDALKLSVASLAKPSARRFAHQSMACAVRPLDLRARPMAALELREPIHANSRRAQF